MSHPRYPAYRDSGIPWLGEIPAHWGVKRAMNLFWDRREKKRPDLPVYSVTQSKGVILQEYSPDQIIRSSDNKNDYKRICSGDIVYNKMRMWQGAIGVAPAEGIVSGAYVVCVPRIGAVPQYYTYLFRTPEYLVEIGRYSYGIHDDQNSLRFEDFKNILVITPPLPEQQAIAAYLDAETARIDMLVAHKEQLIALLQERRTALISHAVTRGLDPAAPLRDSGIPWLGEIPAHWGVKRLKYHAGITFSNVDKHSTEGELPVHLCNYVDVYKNDFINTSIEFMEATASPDEIARFALWRGDVIITKDSESWQDIAVPAYVEADLDGVLCGYHLALIRRNSTKLDGRYLFRALQSNVINYQFATAATGITRYGLGKNAIDNGLIPLPPLPEQQAIAAYLDAETARIDGVIARAREGIALLQEYRTALISAAVTGQIDVRTTTNPEDKEHPAYATPA